MVTSISALSVLAYTLSGLRMTEGRASTLTLLIALLAVCLVTGAAIVAVNMLKGGDNQVTADYQNEGYQPPAADRNRDKPPPNT